MKPKQIEELRRFLLDESCFPIAVREQLQALFDEREVLLSTLRKIEDDVLDCGHGYDARVALEKAES